MKKYYFYSALLTLCVLFSFSTNSIAQDCTRSTSFLGELDASDPTYNRIFIGIDGCTLSDAGTDVFYETFEFTVSIPGMYTFSAMGPSDLTAAIYDTSFDPANPCDNLLEYDDDSNPDSPLDPRIILEVNMMPGTYVMVTATFGNGATGPYEWTFDPPADGAVFICVPAVPTMSQWGLILFALFMLNLGVVSIYRQELATAGSASFSMNAVPFNQFAFVQYFGLVFLTLVLVFAIAMSVFAYELMPFDIPGSILTAGLVAYLLQLVFKK